MRSSHRVISSEFALPSVSWMPEELPAQPDAADQIDPADILELFRPLTEEERPISAGKRVIESVPVIAASPWAPLDLSQEIARLKALERERQEQEQARKLEAMKPVPPPPNPVKEAEKKIEEMLAQAQAQADEIVAQAQRVADQMAAEVQDEIEDTRRQAWEESWNAAQADAQSHLQAIYTSFEQVNTWREQMIVQSEDMLIGLVKGIAESMFGNGLDLPADLFQRHLGQVLERAKSLGDLKIYLNPGDLGKVDPDWREFQSSITGNRLQLVPAEAIRPGGCFVQGQMGSVDARVETQLMAVMEAFSSARAEEVIS